MTGKNQQSTIILLSKITNWAYSSAFVPFQISFYTKTDHTLITSKLINAQYSPQNKLMTLNSLFKITHTEDQDSVIIRLAYRMGLRGQIVLGDYPINFSTLNTEKEIKLPLIPNKTQYLVMKKYVPICTSPNSTFFHIFEKNIRIEKEINSKNKLFLKKRQQFFDTFSQRSSIGSTSKDIFSSRPKDLLQEVKKLKKDKNFITKNQNETQNLQQTPLLKSKNNVLNSMSIQRSINRCLSQKSRNTSQRTSSSENKYVLVLDSLNVVPYEEYYETKSRRIQGTSNRNEKGKVSQRTDKSRGRQMRQQRWRQDKILSEYFDEQPVFLEKRKIQNQIVESN